MSFFQGWEPIVYARWPVKQSSGILDPIRFEHGLLLVSKVRPGAAKLQKKYIVFDLMPYDTCIESIACNLSALRGQMQTMATFEI